MKYLALIIFYICGGGLFLLEAAAQTTQEQLKQMRSTVVEKIDGRDYYMHTIRRGQTLYMISKAYGVEVNDIIRDNPGVKEGIKADQRLKILVPGQKEVTGSRPTSKKEKEKPVKEKPAEPAEVRPAPNSAVVAELPCGIDTSTRKPMYRVALMLPLFLSGVEAIDAENPDPEIFETTKSFQFLPYYEGFKMALDSLTSMGLRIKLYVYDVDKDTARTRQLLKKPEMRTMDLIFGLVYHANFKMVAAFAKKNRINLVNPISERSELVEGNPYVFKVQPSGDSQVEQLAAYMSSAFNGGHVLIIRNGKYADRDAPDRLKKECLTRNLNSEVVEGQEEAIRMFSKDQPNYVVAFSDNQAYTLDLLAGLYQLRNEYNLTVIGLPNWPEFDGMENEYLVSLKTHMMARSFIDYNDPMVNRFVRSYQESYKTDPAPLAFRGFDQAFYFLSALRKYGTNIGRCVGEYKPRSLASRFEFMHSGNNGLENRHWMIYKYENYRQVSVD